MAINIGKNDDGDVTYQNPPVNRVLFPNISEYATPEAIEAFVNAWLDEHPEATTSVEDGSILPVKLDSANSPSGGYILSYNATAGKFEWVNVDSELNDINDEITSLRADLSDVNERLDFNSGQELITWTDGAYIKTSDATVNVNNPVSIASWRYAILNCKEGDGFVLNGSGGSAPRLWAFTDSSYNVLLVADASTTASNLAVIAPENSAYFIVNDNAKNADSYKGNYLVSTVNGIREDFDFDINLIRETNILFHKSEIVVSGTGTSVYKDIYVIPNVQEGDVYGIQYGTLSGELNSSAVGYIYGFSGSTYTSYSTLRKDSKFVTYTVPSGVDKVVFELYPSSIGATTATYTDVLIYKGVSPTYNIKSDVLSKIKVSPDETTFFHLSANLLNPDTVVLGEYVNQSNGTFSDNVSYNRSNYVAIEPSQQYFITSNRTGYSIDIRIAWYTYEKVFISGELMSGAGSYIRTAPSNAYYVALSTSAFYFPMMIAKSSSVMPFESYNNVYVLPQYVPSDDVENVLLNLPSKCYATSGLELNIYFENITENWEKYAWNVDCSKGTQYARGFKFTPTDSDTGTYSLTISCSPKNDLSKTKSVTTSLIVTASDAGSETTASVIILGDSTTDNGTVITKLHDDFDGDSMDVTTLGTRGIAPNNHEGRSGWTLNDYFTKASITYPEDDPRGTIYNPFYNPTSQTWDASYYFANSGISVPDYFIINMGINDMFSFTSDSALETQIETCLGYLNSMVTSIKAVSANINVCICVTIPPNDSQDAFGKAYACGQTRNQYKHNNASWANAIISTFAGEESNGVYLIPIHTNLDTIYNMGMETLPVNARNTDITYESPIGNGGVHPATSGYWQIADVYMAFLKGNAT